MNKSPSSDGWAWRRGPLRPFLATLAIAALVVVQLRWQGRVWWCSCGRPNLWWGDVRSGHCSQHLLDPYSFTHLSHGPIFYEAIAWLLPRLPSAWKLVLVVAVESLWEVVENTQFVIDRYRAETVAFGYEGDSIANSLGDILFCAIGAILARRLGLRWSIALFLLIELVMLAWIRDNLILNVVTLLLPLDAIKSWQAAGG